MRIGNYSALVVPGVEQDSGHVGMYHGAQYGVRLGNHGSERCAVDITIDGKEIGTFQMHPSQMFTLERPPNDPGRFTFYRVDSQEARATSLHGVASSDLGLIVARFRPEARKIEHVQKTSFGFAPDVASSCRGAGGTGLSGRSSQGFRTVDSFETDPNRTVTINLRLVETCSDGPHQLVAATRSNRVPDPV